MKKAQIQGQIFIYLLGLVIVSLLLLYGYKAVSTFRENAEQVSFIQFRSRLLSTIETIKSDYGTVQKDIFNVPSKYDTVCFVELGDNLKDPSGWNPPPLSLANKYPLIDASWTDKVLANIFLVRGQFIEPLFSGDKETSKSFINVQDASNYICIPVPNHKLNIKIEGRGNYAIISAQ